MSNRENPFEILIILAVVYALGGSIGFAWGYGRCARDLHTQAMDANAGRWVVDDNGSSKFVFGIANRADATNAESMND